MNNSTINRKRKKNKANAFWCFHQEQLKSPDLQHLTASEKEIEIGRIWSEMTQDDKDRYKSLAKTWNANNNISTCSFRPPSPDDPRLNHSDHQHVDKKPRLSPGALDSRGLSIADEQRKLDEAKAYKKQMDKTVVDLIDASLDDAVFNTTNYHLIATQHFYLTDHMYPAINEIYPAEIAIGKFSLREGVHERFHATINPGRLPIEATYEAGRKSAREHLYQLPAEDDQADYTQLFHDISTFLKSETQKEIPIFYAREEEISKVKMILNKIFTQCGEGSDKLNSVHVYSVERLMYRLHLKTVEIGNVGVDKDSSDYLEPTLFSDAYAREEFRLKFFAIDGCAFHEGHSKDRFCALANVSGYGYAIADVVCSKQLNKIEGQHFPRVVGAFKIMTTKED